jgi:hypothetical protein
MKPVTRATANGTILALALALALVSGSCAAAVFTWRDSGGVEHYSQTPPTGRPYKRLNVTPSAAFSAPGIAGIKNAADAGDQRARAAEQAREARLHARAERLAACAKARSRASFLEQKTARRLFVRQADGTSARMTEPEFRQRLDQARAAIRANCKR